MKLIWNDNYSGYGIYLWSINTSFHLLLQNLGIFKYIYLNNSIYIMCSSAFLIEINLIPMGATWFLNSYFSELHDSCQRLSTIANTGTWLRLAAVAWHIISQCFIWKSFMIIFPPDRLHLHKWVLYTRCMMWQCDP